MRFLSADRVLDNTRLATKYLPRPEGGPEGGRAAFFWALNAAQGTTIRTDPVDVFLEFDNPELAALLAKRTVFSAEEIAGGRHLIPPAEREWVTGMIESAKRLIGEADRDLLYLIRQLVGSIALYRIDARDGGSVSCCIGLIWLSPRRDWTPTYCAEMMVHEFVHNSLFLEDMVQGIMPSPDLLEREEALSVSAIRQTRRPYDKAFHSACVAAGLMHFYRAMNRVADGARFRAPLERTLVSLETNDRLLREQGLNVLTDNGRDILNEIHSFLRGWSDGSHSAATAVS